MPIPRNQGTLEVGHLDGEVIINHPRLDVDAQGRGYIVFSPDQARCLAATLIRQAKYAEQSKPKKQGPTIYILDRGNR